VRTRWVVPSVVDHQARDKEGPRVDWEVIHPVFFKLGL
jgi:hypothetical protein